MKKISNTEAELEKEKIKLKWIDESREMATELMRISFYNN